MCRRRVSLLLLAATVACLRAQDPIAIKPDCQFFFTATAAGAQSSFDNRQAGCTFWTFAYMSTGFSALSIVLQEAPDSSGSPGAFVTFTGTITTGVNPQTAITQAETAGTGYRPWMRMNITTVTGSGTIRGVMYGNKRSAGANATIVGNVSVIGPTAAGVPPTTAPVLVAGQDGAPGNIRTLQTDERGNLGTVSGCTQRANISLTAAGNTQIIAASGSTVIRVCHISFALQSAADIKLVEGGGVNCATAPVDITGLYRGVTSIALDPLGSLRTSASQALCLNQSAAVNTGGVVTFGQF